MSKRTTKSGDKFGHLTVLQYSTEKKGWQCRCDCGSISYRNIYDLKHRKHLSCGCQINKHRIKPNKHALKYGVYYNYKNSANKKGLKFELTLEQCVQFFENNCTYCDSPPSNVATTRKDRRSKNRHVDTYVYNGIDRIDSSIGYTILNCVSCCAVCNVSKNNLTLQEWKDWIKRVYSRTFNDYPVKGVESSDSKQETPEHSG